MAMFAVLKNNKASAEMKSTEWFALRKFLMTSTAACITAAGLDHFESTQDFFARRHWHLA